MREGVLAGGAPYLEFGTGSPLVVFRTVLPDSANPTGFARWAEVRSLKPLAERFTVLTVGRRPGLRPGVTMAELAAHHAEELRHRFDRPVDVLGLSTAGSLALQFAADHPGLVRRLVVGAAGTRLGAEGRRVQRRYADLLAAGRHRAAAMALAPTVADSRPGRALLAGLLGLASGRPADPDGMVAMLRAEDAFDIEDRLGEITAPTLVIAGSEDALYPLELAERVADKTRRGDLKVYPGRRHHTVMSDRRFTKDVFEFLL
ncbi:Serine aminopeptidase, S33 [Amycolatopsis lurida]|uniref:Hydrolase n=1 Tax=Amycolatopsis lurida NRRL 2430 TaxID=1460371 RepID=A0A2P2FQW3_AMYLU|nr:alpha/beta hydrolase [Amycolatopsis lurida]KFU79122.1 hydrolase [Amycolatopsis lurida NRRL 2430]SED71426.1 Serine aminopeptidase, S33 [Amycolatopsis lurida]